MSNIQTTYLQTLNQIPDRPDIIVTRGGHYSRELNVWVTEDLESFLQNCNKSQHALLDAFARMVLEAGRIHQAQIRDSKAGRVWPAAWIERADGDRLVSFCREYPEAGHP